MIGIMQDKLDLKKTSLGIELGSTRMKAVLINSDHKPIASGEYNWESSLENGLWTYSMEEVWTGLQSVFRQLTKEVDKKFNLTLTNVGSMGVSAMMHGYLPFDANGEQLVPFRTWSNTTTGKASEVLTNLFKFNIPHRWSVSHLYQAILGSEGHVEKLDYLTTLAGYVHWKLTGEKVLGVGEASGMFPISPKTGDYDSQMMEQFHNLLIDHNYTWSFQDVLPKVKTAGEHAGTLTKEGARLLDPTGTLQSGIPFCPPEGDAGTGMVATNSVKEHTGNVSAGTSIFSMVVLEENLKDYYTEIDIVTTPDGKPVAMVHCNNFTSDINAWASLFGEFSNVLGEEISKSELFKILFNQAMLADHDVGQLVICNYYSGEPITEFEEGRPLLVRMPDSNLTLPNFMRAQIYSSLSTLRIGMDILTKEENVQVDYILGHGGFFKTENVGQQLMADAINIPVSVMDTAGEGGPWGIALLASYMINKKGNQSLEEYLQDEVFVSQAPKMVQPTKEGIEAFANYLERFHKGLEIERTAIQTLR